MRDLPPASNRESGDNPDREKGDRILGRRATRQRMARPPTRSRGSNRIPERGRRAPLRASEVSSSVEPQETTQPKQESAEAIIEREVILQGKLQNIRKLLTESYLEDDELLLACAVHEVNLIMEEGNYEFLFTASEHPIHIYQLDSNTDEPSVDTDVLDIGIIRKGDTIVLQKIMRCTLNDLDDAEIFLGNEKQAIKSGNLARSLLYEGILGVRPKQLS